jgi:hypothetical protein
MTQPGLKPTSGRCQPPNPSLFLSRTLDLELSYPWDCLVLGKRGRVVTPRSGKHRNSSQALRLVAKCRLRAGASTQELKL